MHYFTIITIIFSILTSALLPAWALSPDSYENDNIISQAALITLNGKSQSHNFHTQGDEDWVKFYGIKTETYTIKVSNPGEDCDAIVELYDTDGATMLKSKDFGLQGENESMDWECPEHGIYYVRISHYLQSFGEKMTYTLDMFRTHSCLTGIVTGTVTNAFLKEPVKDACISTDPNDSAISQADGAYQIVACDFSETLFVKAEGFDLFSTPVTVPTQETITKNITLTPSAQLSVKLSPETQKILSKGGTLTYAVSNTGTGQMKWSAKTDDSWLAIASGSTGTNNETITINYASNDTGRERTGTITVTAASPGAKDSPLTVSVIQPLKSSPKMSITPESHDFGTLHVESPDVRAGIRPTPERGITPLEQLGYAYAENQVIVKLANGRRSRRAITIQENLNASVVGEFSSIDAELWHISETTVKNAVMQYWNDPSLEYMEPNLKLNPISMMPDDPDFSKLWGLNNTGQTQGTPDADIDAPEAWNIQKTSNIVIAVIDTGVDYTHPDLAANMWKNPGEIPDNGKDDDNNGYIDDVHGYDFVNKDGDPFDDHHHGTHCAGTIAGVGNNNAGVTGVNWQAKIMALKFLNANGVGHASGAIHAIEYATRMGVKITSNSWGGGTFSNAMYEAIQAAGNAGQIFVAAAGNNYQNNDFNPHYPSGYNLDNIISIASTDHKDMLSSFSNYGPVMVDIAAPGSNIYSTVPGNKYTTISGTSMATPHVSGVAGLLWSACPDLTPWEIKKTILASADPVPGLQGKVLTAGRLNAYNALTKHKQVFTVTNTGDQYLIPDVFSISGPDQSDFRIQEDNCSNQPLASGESCTLKVQFSHTSLGRKTAYLTVSSNDPAYLSVPLSVTLSGERITPPPVYTMNVSKNGEGQVIINDVVCDAGSCKRIFEKGSGVNLEALPRDKFTEWSGDLGGSTNPATIEMDENKSIIANFGTPPSGDTWSAVISAEGVKAEGAEQVLGYEEWQALGDSQNQILVNKYNVTIGMDAQAQANPAPASPPRYSVQMDIRDVEDDKWKGPFVKDIRQQGKNICKWILAINPHGNVPPPDERTATLRWDPSEFSTGSYKLRQGYDGTGEIVVDDMRITNEYSVTGGNEVRYFTVEYAPDAPPAGKEWETMIQARGQEIQGVEEVLNFEEWQALGDDQSRILVNQYNVTLGIDTGADTNLSPPSPPRYSVKLDLYEVEGNNWTDAFLKDIQKAGEEYYQWVIAINPHGNMPPPDERTATITWNPEKFSSSGYYRLKKGYDGTGEIVIADMKNQASYEVRGGDSAQYFTMEYSLKIFNDATGVIGDMDGNGAVDIKDAIAVLKAMAGMNPDGIIPDYAGAGVDADGDNKIGLEEAACILQKVSGLRP